MNSQRGPSLKKARAPEFFERNGSFVRTTEGRWRDLFRTADVMSEGGIRDELGSRVYYGSTSLILGLPNELPATDRALLLALAEKDLHVHLHALRYAHREAQSRAPGSIGRTSCDVRFRFDPRGLRIDVDVQAPLIERRRVARTAP